MPSTSSSDKNLTVKQQREARRAEKVAALAKQQARQKRNRTIGIVSAIVGGVAVVGVVIAAVVVPGMMNANNTTRLDPSEITVEGVALYPDLPSTHVGGRVNYPVTPPVGGEHNPAWLNCGVYTQQVQNENAVHSLEHGAVWVTYNPDQITDEDISTLRERLPDSYVILSPYPGITSPVIASAWGAQLTMDDVNDERLDSFVQKYWKSLEAPEPGASCSGAIDGPGKVS